MGVLDIDANGSYGVGAPMGATSFGFPSASMIYREPVYTDSLQPAAYVDKPSGRASGRPKLVLPARAQDDIEEERRRLLRQFSVPYSYRRPLTDDECFEEYGATLDELRKSVAYWRSRLDGLPTWPKWRKRRERREAAKSLLLAEQRRDEAERGRYIQEETP